MCICFNYNLEKPDQGNKLLMDGYNLHINFLLTIGIVEGKVLEDIFGIKMAIWHPGKAQYK